MPKGNTNTKACRKLDILTILKREHALSAVEISSRMKMTVRSIRRFLLELRIERKIYRRYQMRDAEAKRPTFYYSLRRDKV